MAALHKRLNFIQPLLRQDCVLCGLATSALICSACDAALPRILRACPGCAAPRAISNSHGEDAERCGECLREPPQFARATAALVYEFPVDKLIHALKYRGQLALAHIFGAALVQALRAQPRPDAILPMPLHPQRLAERGYNQAQLIAQVVSSALMLPLASLLAQRAVNTLPQAGLALSGRRKNVRNAFSCAADLRDKHIAILDDVMASGATVNELAKCMRAAGAREVSVWVAARAVAQR